MVKVTTFAKHAILHCMAPQFVHNNFGHRTIFPLSVAVPRKNIFGALGSIPDHNFYMGTQNGFTRDKC